MDIIDDFLYEHDEMFLVEMELVSEPFPGLTIDKDNVSITIIDNDGRFVMARLECMSMMDTVWIFLVLQIYRANQSIFCRQSACVILLTSKLIHITKWVFSLNWVVCRPLLFARFVLAVDLVLAAVITMYLNFVHRYYCYTKGQGSI